MTTLKEKIFEYIQKHGPKSNAELAAKFKAAPPSVRRTCGDMAREGTLVPVPSSGDKRVWGLSADARAEPSAPSTKGEAEPTPIKKMPAPTKATKKEEPPVDVKDWRMTDFCF